MKMYILSDLRDSFTELTRPLEPFFLGDLENIPHLHSLNSERRERMGSPKIFRERTLQDKNEYFDFIRRFNNDTVYRLRVTKQYYLLSLLFEDPSNKTKWLALLEEMEEDDENKQQLRDIWTLHELSRIQQDKAQREVELKKLDSNLPHFDWTHPDPSLSNIAKLFHYERERQRITVAYHNARADVSIRTFDRYVAEARAMVRVMELGGPENQESAKKFNNKLDELVQQKNMLMVSAPRGMDVISAQKRDVTLEELVKKASATALEALANSDFDENQIQRFNEIAEQDKKQKSSIQSNFEERLKSLDSAANKVLNSTKADISNVLDAVIGKLGDIDLEREGTPKNTIIDSIEQIRSLRSGVDSSKDGKTLLEILLKCREVINKMPEPEKILLKSEITLIEQYIAESALSLSLNNPMDSSEKINISAEPVEHMPPPSAPPFEGNIGGTGGAEPVEHMPPPSAPSFEGNIGDTGDAEHVDGMPPPSAPPLEINIEDTSGAVPMRNMPPPSAPPFEKNTEDNGYQVHSDVGSSLNATSETIQTKESPSENITTHAKSKLLGMKGQKNGSSFFNSPLVPNVDIPQPSAPPREISDRGRESGSVNSLTSSNDIPGASAPINGDTTTRMKSKLQGMIKGDDLNLKEALKTLSDEIIKARAISPENAELIRDISVMLKKINPLANIEEEREKIEEMIGNVQMLGETCEQLSHLKDKLVPIQTVLDNFANSAGLAPGN